MRAALVTLAMVLAGCFGGGGGGTSTPTPTTTDTPGPGDNATPQPIAMLLDFAYTGCRGIGVLATADTAEVQAALPPGYTAVPDLEGGTVVDYVWWACDVFATAASQVNETVLGFIIAHASAPDGSSVFYLLRMLVQDDILRTVWDVAGYDLYVGAYGYEGTPDLAPLPEVRRVVSFAELQVDGVGWQAAEVTEGPIEMWTETAAGRLEWTMEGFTFDVIERAASAQWSRPADDPFPSAQQQVISWVEGAEMTGIDLWLYPN